MHQLGVAAHIPVAVAKLIIDGILNEALLIVTKCLRPTPMDNLPVLSGIQPAELRCQGATLSLANWSSLNPGHILHGQLTESQVASKARLKSRHPFVPAVLKLLCNLSKLGILATQWTNLTWDSEYSSNRSTLCVYVPKVNTRLIGMSLSRRAFLKLNHLRIGVSSIGSPMHKWVFASLTN